MALLPMPLLPMPLLLMTLLLMALPQERLAPRMSDANWHQAVTLISPSNQAAIRYCCSDKVPLKKRG